MFSVRSKNKRGPNAVDLGYSIDGSARHNRNIFRLDRTFPHSQSKATRTDPRTSLCMCSAQDDLFKITRKLILHWVRKLARPTQKEFEVRLRLTRTPAARSARQRWSCSRFTRDPPCRRALTSCGCIQNAHFYCEIGYTKKTLRHGVMIQKRKHVSILSVCPSR